jgi:hypothetical protein
MPFCCCCAKETASTAMNYSSQEALSMPLNKERSNSGFDSSDDTPSSGTLELQGRKSTGESVKRGCFVRCCLRHCHWDSLVKFFGLRHHTNHFLMRIWAVVCLCFSAGGLATIFLPVYDGPLSIFSKVLVGLHNSVAVLCYICLMDIFCNTSEPYIFQNKSFEPNPDQELDRATERPEHPGCLCDAFRRLNRACRRAFRWIVTQTFSFEGLTLLSFAASWSYYWWWLASEANNASSPLTPGPSSSGVHVYIYLILVSTFPWRVGPCIVATHLIIINFKRFEELAKEFYLNHRRKPLTPVVVGVVPTRFFSKSQDPQDFLRNCALSTHDLFFIGSVRECRSVEFDFKDFAENNIKLSISLVTKNTNGLMPLWPKKGTFLRIKCINPAVEENSKCHEKFIQLPDLPESQFKRPEHWTPFISVCTPGVKIITNARHGNGRLFRSAYVTSGFKKQDINSCFEASEVNVSPKEFVLTKGDTHFYETAILCQSQQVPKADALDVSHTESEARDLHVEIHPPVQSDDNKTLYQPSTELMSQLVRNGLLNMKTFLHNYKFLFWVMVLFPLVNMVVFILDVLLPGNSVYVPLLHLSCAHLHTLSQLHPRPLSRRPSPKPCFFHMLSPHPLERRETDQRLRSRPPQYLARHLKRHDSVPRATGLEPIGRCALSRQFKPAQACGGYHPSHNARASAESAACTGDHCRAFSHKCSKTALSFLKNSA